MSVIVAERLVEHLERSGLVIIKKPPLCEGGASSDVGSRMTDDGLRPTEQHLAVLAQETGNFSGVTPRAGGVAWGGTPRGPGDQAFESWPATDREARH